MENLHQRATWHDYSTPGVYMITLVAEQRGTPFGELAESENGRIIVKLTSLGQEVERQLHELPKHAEGLTILRLIVMPDHVHVVLQITQPLQHHLGTLVRGFKYGTTVKYLRDLDAHFGGTHRISGSRPSATQRAAASTQTKADKPPSTQPPTSPFPSIPPSVPSSPSPQPAAGSVGGGSSASSPASIPASIPSPLSPSSSPSIHFVPPLWSEGYHDRILYGRQQLSRMLHYVSDNPRRGWIKHQHRDLFYNKHLLQIPLTIDQARWLLREARSIGAMQELKDVLRVEQLPPGNSSWQPLSWWIPGERAVQGAQLRATLCMKAMGNQFLIDEALLLPVRISRSILPAALQEQKTSLLQHCENEGAVIITPGISPGEKAVLSATLDAGFSAIRLLATAMSDVWAPSEPFLAPISQGRLLFLSPWPNRPQSEHPHKGIFELLNLLCRLLASR